MQHQKSERYQQAAQDNGQKGYESGGFLTKSSNRSLPGRTTVARAQRSQKQRLPNYVEKSLFDDRRLGHGELANETGYHLRTTANASCWRSSMRQSAWPPQAKRRAKTTSPLNVSDILAAPASEISWISPMVGGTVTSTTRFPPKPLQCVLHFLLGKATTLKNSVRLFARLESLLMVMHRLDMGIAAA